MDEIRTFASDVIRALGVPQSSPILDLVSRGDWGGLSQHLVTPSSYPDSESYFRAHQAVEAFRKLEGVSSASTRAAALRIWLEDEKFVFETNRRLYPYLDSIGNRDQACETFLVDLRKELQVLLGPGPNPSEIRGRFGPGTTAMHRGARCLIPDKLSHLPEMTKNAFPLASAFLIQEQFWCRAVHGLSFSACVIPKGTFQLVSGSRWSSVPKDVSKDRSIGIEPTFNLWYQLGIGGAWKGRLQRHGLLLDNGRSEKNHRALARESSRTGHLATIDLSSASDTVSSALVRLCIPRRWLELLEDTRCSHTLIEGKPHRLEKFSSMGNGFTFELETAIFAGIARVIARYKGVTLIPGENFGVYGDDIIVPVELDSLLRKALSFAGFKVNERKSFASGPFRESCGGDFFNGIDVRPVYFKKPPRCPAEWYPWLNMLQRLIPRFPDLEPVWKKWVNRVPEPLRLYGPESLGDVVLHTEDSSLWRTRRQLSGKPDMPNDWMAIRALLPQAERYPLERWGDETAVLASVYGCSGDGIAPRNSILGYRTRWVAYG